MEKTTESKHAFLNSTYLTLISAGIGLFFAGGLFGMALNDDSLTPYALSITMVIANCAALVMRANMIKDRIMAEKEVEHADRT